MRNDLQAFPQIGNNVWSGCGVKIYKGTVIPDNCVIASNSIVKGVFKEENSLIGGNPASIIAQITDCKIVFFWLDQASQLRNPIPYLSGFVLSLTYD